MADQDIVIQIQTDMAQFHKDMADVKHALRLTGQETKKTGEATKGLSLSFGVMSKTALAAAAALTAMAAKQASAALETQRWARALNIASTDLGELGAVARRFGSDTEDVGDAIKDLNERIADAAGGNKTYEEALNRVGLASRDLIGLRADQQFIRVADAIGKLNNVGDQNFVTAELMADAGFRLLEVFRLGEEGIAAYRKEVVKTGEAMSAQDFKNFSTLGKEVSTTWALVQGTFNKATKDIWPEFNRVLRLTNKAIRNFNELLDDTKVDAKEAAKEVDFLTTAMQKAGKSGTTSAMDVMNARLDGAKKKLEELKIILGDSFSQSHALAKPLVQRIAMLERHLANIGKLDVPEKLKEKVEALGGTMEEASAPINVDIGDEEKKKGKALEILEPSVIEEEMARLDEALHQKEVLKLESQRREEEAHKAWLDRMFGHDARAQEQNRKLWEHSWQGKQKVTSKFLGDISKLMNTNSRKQFEIGKAAAIAQVAIDTPKAAMSAYSAMAGIPYVGPVLGAAAAAAAIATGAGQIQNIKSQSFGGGGGVGGGIGAAGGAGAAGAAEAQGGGTENVLDATFNIQGTSVSKDQIRTIGSELNELAEDGFKLRSVTVI